MYGGYVCTPCVDRDHGACEGKCACNPVTLNPSLLAPAGIESKDDSPHPAGHFSHGPPPAPSNQRARGDTGGARRSDLVRPPGLSSDPSSLFAHNDSGDVPQIPSTAHDPPPEGEAGGAILEAWLQQYTGERCGWCAVVLSDEQRNAGVVLCSAECVSNAARFPVAGLEGGV